MSATFWPDARERAGHGAMLLFSALVGGSFSFGGRIANDIDPMALTPARFLLAALVIGAAVLATRGLRASDYRAPWRFFILGGLFAIYFVLMFEGLKTAPPVSASAVFTLTPIMAAGFGWLLLRQITTPRMALALGIGGAGALWVIFRADLAAFLAFEVGQGELIYFFGCIAHALYAPMVPRLNRGEPALTFTFGMLLAGLVVLVVFGWPAIRATPWLDLSAQVWLTLFYLAVFASAATFVLLQFASLRMPAAKVMAYTYLVPSWVIIWEIILGGAVPTGLLLIGVGLTVLALGLLLQTSGQTQKG